MKEKRICMEGQHCWEQIRIAPLYPEGCISDIYKSTCRICGLERWSYKTTGGGCPVEISDACSCGCRVYYTNSMTITCAACGREYKEY